MKISIITPSFNQDKFISKTIDSVLKQKGNFEIEYFVMDGGSSDKTIEILKGYDQKIKNKKFIVGNKGIKFYWQSKKDKGQSDAINQGIKKASGDVIAYINSDDTYTAGTFQKVVDAFHRNNDKLWLTGYCRIIDCKDRQIQLPITKYKNFWLNNYSYKKLLVLNFISQPATFWQAKIVKTHGAFDENLHLTMDYDYWLRIGANSEPIIIKEYLANFRIHGTSKGKVQFIKQFDQDLKTCFKYSNSSLLRNLHKLHNFFIITGYKLIK